MNRCLLLILCLIGALPLRAEQSGFSLSGVVEELKEKLRPGPKVNDGTNSYSIAELKALAEKGDAKAQHGLGMCYFQGLGGLPEDQEAAIPWFKKSAAQGYMEAQHTLGYCYANGQGVARDMTEAVKWLRLAAAAG